MPSPQTRKAFPGSLRPAAEKINFGTNYEIARNRILIAVAGPRHIQTSHIILMIPTIGSMAKKFRTRLLPTVVGSLLNGNKRLLDR